jgi:hypothetical protein
MKLVSVELVFFREGLGGSFYYRFVCLLIGTFDLPVNSLRNTFLIVF